MIWLARLSVIALLSLVHLTVFIGLISAEIGGMLQRGPHGEELGGHYRISAEGRHNRALTDVLSWPLVKPVELAGQHLSSATVQSAPWRLFSQASFYGNSLVWGISLWLVIEFVIRGAVRLRRRRI